MDDRGIYNYSHGQLWQYLAAKEDIRRRIFNCPDDPDPRYAGIPGSGLPDLTHPRNFTYVLTGQLAAQPVRITRVRCMANKFLVLEVEHPITASSVPSEVWPNVTPGSEVACLLTTRHNKQANEGFFDGHVELIDPLIFANTQRAVYTPVYAHYYDLLADQ